MIMAYTTYFFKKIKETPHSKQVFLYLWIISSCNISKLMSIYLVKDHEGKKAGQIQIPPTVAEQK